MVASSRPRRSVLFMPGVNRRAMEKARGLPADVLIFDLEDSVLPDAKAAARENIAAMLAEGGYGGRERVLRINGLDTPWGRDDLAAAIRLNVDAVLVPKIDTAGAVRRIEGALSAAGAPASLALWCMIETPMAVLQAAEIAAATPRLAALVMGTEDLAKDLRAQHMPDRLSMLTAFGLTILAARAHGLAVLDAIHRDLADDAGFRTACAQGRALGFDGKTLIHPKTIADANAAFGPSLAELDEARRVIAAQQAAAATGQGITTLDGKLIEPLHVASAQRLLALAAAIAARESGN